VVSGTATEIYLYYDSEQADNDTYVGETRDAVTFNVWDSYSKATWHMNEDTNVSIEDSTVNDNTGFVAGGDPNVSVAGIAGGAFRYDGTNDMFGTGYDSSLGLNDWEYFTVSAWFKPTNHSGDDFPCLFCYGSFDFTLGLNKDSAGDDGQLEVWMNDFDSVDGGGVVSTLDKWNHAVVIRNPTNTITYLNGVQVDSALSVNIGGFQESCFIGGSLLIYSADASFIGDIDEVRVAAAATASGVRSPAWIKADYYTLKTSLTSFSEEEIYSTPEVVNPHSVLNQLDYASAGHIGFQPAGDYATNDDLATTSGTLQDAIDTKSSTLLELTDTPAGYDNEKYLISTASGTEWSTVSTDLVSDTSPELGGDLDTGAYTVSGTGPIYTGDHVTTSGFQVVNVMYGEYAPSVSGVPNATLYIHIGMAGYIYVSNEWKLFAGQAEPPPGQERGVFGGGYTGSATDTIDYITISTPTTCTDFGDLTEARNGLGATSNGSTDRGIFAGGIDGPTVTDTIDYIAMTSAGNAVGWGDLTDERGYVASCSNGVYDRGCFAGGYDGIGDSDIIDYITISTPNVCTDFGDLTVARSSLGSCSNATGQRGIFAGGFTELNTIDYITISTPTTCTDFGDLTVARDAVAGTSNGINDRGVFAGGNPGPVDVIDYITISSTPTCTNFGDLTVARSGLGATSDGTNERGVFAGGSTIGANDTIDYITISTFGNATDWGDLTLARSGLAGTSNA